VRADEEAEEAAAPRGPLGLWECVAIGMESQPAISAAQSAYDAALAGQSGINGLRFAGLLAKDLPVRRQQAAWGVNATSAAVGLAESETRYAVIRTFYTVMYAHQQLKLLDHIIENLSASKKTAEDFSGVADSKVTKTDVLVFGTYLARLQAKRAQAKWGMQKAIAALREAMGFHGDCPLELIEAPFPDLVQEITCKDVVALAMDRRGELVQANSAEQMTAWEIEAQRRLRFKKRTPTFAAGVDVHARPIPQGHANDEYWPGAIGIEEPGALVGKRGDRIDRQAALHDRAVAVVEKTQNLVALDAEAAFYKWKDAADRVRALAEGRRQVTEAAAIAEKRFRTAKGGLAANEHIRTVTLREETISLYIDALYLHALSLAGLERVTAGGIKPTYAGTPIAFVRP
jgi:outer membrane protein TolC